MNQICENPDNRPWPVNPRPASESGIENDRVEFREVLKEAAGEDTDGD